MKDREIFFVQFLKKKQNVTKEKKFQMKYT